MSDNSIKMLTITRQYAIDKLTSPEYEKKIPPNELNNYKSQQLRFLNLFVFPLKNENKT